MTPSRAAAPTQPNQRIPIIDVLRGFALFGILLVNMELFNDSVYSMIMELDQPATTLDQLARWFIAFFGEGKFYSIFAFLFGLGMQIQYARAQAKGVRFVPLTLRRLLVLFVFGLIHAYLFWVGDILILYSVLGVVLLFFFRNRRPKTLLVWTVIFLLVPVILNAALIGLAELARQAPDGAQTMETVFAEQDRMYRAWDAEADQVYATGSFAAITRQRVGDVNFMFGVMPFIAFNVLAMMVLGLYAGKRGIFEHLEEYLPPVRTVMIWGLVIGVIGNLLYVVAGQGVSRNTATPSLLLSLVGQIVGAPALSLFYMAGLTLLYQRAAWRRRLTPLAAVGRMAISNYLLQSVLCTTLFYGYGFGLYGWLGIAGGVLLTVVIYLLQVIVSNLWLRRFRFGPVEWLWRSLTYLRWQPMRVKAHA